MTSCVMHQIAEPADSGFLDAIENEPVGEGEGVAAGDRQRQSRADINWRFSSKLDNGPTSKGGR